MPEQVEESGEYPCKEQILSSPISVLLYSRGLELFDQANLRLVIEQYKPFSYPDGTLEILCHNDAAANDVYRELPVRALVHSSIHFRNLLGFPLWRYYLVFGKDYDDKMRDEGIGLGVGVLSFYPGEWKKKRLQFTVIFYRKPIGRTINAFIDRFSKFFLEIKISGLDSEGPLLPASPIVKFRGNRAEIWLDASRTGPRTLVWILLESFSFGHEIAPVKRALFNQDDEVNIQRDIIAARKVAAITKQSWTPEDERRFLEDGRGGVGEPEIELPLSVT